MESNRRHELLLLSGIVFFLIGTYVASINNYPFFHSIVEGLSIVISFTVFAIAWNSRKYIEDGYLVVIGIAYLFIGFIDFMHTLAYKGMNVFPEFDANLPTQLWIAARYFESITILVVVWLVGRKKSVNEVKLFIFFTVLTIAINYSIFFSDLFPVCFVEGQGLTPFKRFSEYIIILILGIASVSIIRKRKLFAENIARLILLSIIMTMISELAFTFYIDSYGLSNLIGHYFKIVSFYFIYQAIVVTGIREPYNLIFKELMDKNEKMEILNGQLQKSAEAVEQAVQTKSKYLSVMSHEMRTPLNGILGFTQLIKFTPITEEQLGYVDQITVSANVLRQNIDNILDMEKYLARKMLYIAKPGYLKEILDEKLTFFDGLCKERGLAFHSSINIDNELKVLVDKDKISQLLNNLVSNAVKFTEEGHIDLSITSETKDEGVHVEMQVRDTGIGISEADQKKVFESYVQVGQMQPLKYGGSGLGLSICKEIVSYYDGEIKVKSELNKGTSFYINFWLKEYKE